MPNDRYSAEVWAVWAYWQVLRQIGFESDSLFVSVHESPIHGPVVGVMLRAQGQEFLIDAARLDGDEAVFQSAWIRFCEDMLAHRIDEDLLSFEWERSKARHEVVGILRALIEKGFELPSERQTA